MKKNTQKGCALLLMALLSGCNSDSDSDNTPTTTPTPTTPTTPSVPSVPTEPSVPSVPTEPTTPSEPSTPQPVDPLAKNKQQLDQELTALVNDPARPLASMQIAIIRQGKIEHLGNYGQRFIAATPEQSLPVTSETKFRIASVSKTLVPVAILQLVEAGKMGLDDDASSLLGFTLRNPNFPDLMITPRMLLNHTSSLRDGAGYNFPLGSTLADYLTPAGNKYAASAWSSSKGPGSYFNYVNLNMGVLASIIERVSGERFDIYARDHILKPLKLNASYNVQDFSDADFTNIATLYRKRDANNTWDSAGAWYKQGLDEYQSGRPTPLYSSAQLASYVLGSNGTLFSPHGGLRISAGDLARFALALMNKGSLDNVTLLQPSSVELLFKQEWNYVAAESNGNNYYGLFRSWGLGFQRFTDTEGGDRLNSTMPLKWVGHLGDAYGLLSGMVFDPESGDGMVYIVGGVGANPDDNFGKISAFYYWEEQALEKMYNLVLSK